MPTFVHTPLLWGLLIVGVPIAIHLINMLRHRRVEWAAMEFLLFSQKKHRTWIILKQLLLLLLRMAAIAVVVLLVAQPKLRNEFGNLFGSTKTHHIVLLDDSFSMSDRWADRNALGEGKSVVARIAAEAARQVQPQTFTLLRFSRAGQSGRGTEPDLLVESVTHDFPPRLAEVLDKLEASQTAAGPAAAIGAIGQLLAEGSDERRIIYLISDFRAREWDNPTDLRQQLAELNKTEAELHLINCVDRVRPNLAITALAPAEGIHAAGVPWFMEVAVHNFGPAPAKDVHVLVDEDGRTRPAVTIAEIPAGRTVKERFQVHFPTAGEHQVTARLEGDAVAADDNRYAAVVLPAEVPVLLIDGSPDFRDARYIEAAAAPGGAVRTGLKPQIEPPRYLGLKPLGQFRAILLLNVERLDPSAVEALERFVAAGGGLSVFLGEQSDARFINDRLYRGGQGFFPVPVEGPNDLTVDRVERGPDLQVGDHPIFRVLAGKRNSFISTVLVERYFAVPASWAPEADSATQVIARLRNRAPLVVERRKSQGRVLAFLTTAAPVWNNWARNPSFVVAVQDLLAYLAERSAEGVSQQVGERLRLSLDANEYQPQVRFVAPAKDATPSATIDAVPTAKGVLAASFADTQTSGIYEARLTRTNGATETRHYAVNVEAAEGDLQTVAGTQLAERLGGVKYVYQQAAMFQSDTSDIAGHNVAQWLLYTLIVLLIGEQVLAWSAGYHPPARLRGLSGAPT